MTDERIKIMTVVSSDLDRRFFIDCPVRTIMEPDKCVRMEIPQELAKYIFDLQLRNSKLESELRELSRKR